MGGFTTYSTFNTDTLRLVQEGQAGLAAIHVVATLTVCLGAGALGLWLGR